MRYVATTVAASSLTLYAAAHGLGRRAGSTATERRVVLPGDDLVPRPQLVTDHAVTIAAPPEMVWPWLTQMGWHRAGWYTPRWVDRHLFPGNRPSLDVLDPDLVRDLGVADTIPDGPPGTAEFVVSEVRAPELLVLRSTSHLPPGWAAHGAAIVWTWCLRLTPREGGRATRLHLRVRGRMSPWWVTAAYLAVIGPADLVMATGMLRGVRQRAERDYSGPGSAPTRAHA